MYNNVLLGVVILPPKAELCWTGPLMWFRGTPGCSRTQSKLVLNQFSSVMLVELSCCSCKLNTRQGPDHL